MDQLWWFKGCCDKMLKQLNKCEIIECGVKGVKMSEFLKAFFLIFVAEMGDKTQIMAMAFATQYAVRGILSGVFIGSFLNHGIAILLGAMFLSKVPMDLLQLIAGGLFLFFGLMSLKLEDEEEEEAVKKKAYNAVITVALAFFLGELGDKTQLTAMTLGSESTQPFLTLLGTSCGMVLVSSFGIFIGAKLGDKIPEHFMKIGAFVVFTVFGMTKVMGSSYMTPLYAVILSVVLLGITLILGLKFVKQIKANKLSTFKKTAQALQDFKQNLKNDIQSMCKKCTVCEGNQCLIKHVQVVLDETPELESLLRIDLDSITHEGMNIEAAKLIDTKIHKFYDEHPEVEKKELVIKHVHDVVEHMIEENEKK